MLNHDCHICKILLSCVSEGSPGKQAQWNMLSHEYREGRIYHMGLTPSWRWKVPLYTCSLESWAPAGLGTGGSHSARPSLRQENAHIQLSGQAESRPHSSSSLFSSSLEGLDGAPTLMRATFFIQSADSDAHLLQGDP